MVNIVETLFEIFGLSDYWPSLTVSYYFVILSLESSIFWNRDFYLSATSSVMRF